MNFTADTDRLMAVYRVEAHERRRRSRDARRARPLPNLPIRP